MTDKSFLKKACSFSITLLTLLSLIVCNPENIISNYNKQEPKTSQFQKDLETQLSPLLAKLKFLSGETEGCWLSAFGRGIGKPIHTCKKDLEQSGLLCYPTCNAGFTGVGPVCWQNCPSAYRDDGAFCFKPSPYGRGVGYFTSDKCERENPQGCEKYGLLQYPKCAQGFHNVGCCICSPDCPGGMTDIGISCAKKSYGRTAGTPLTCSESEDYDAGLCYTNCDKGFSGLGPICWATCPADYEKCGALCLKGQTCAGEIKQYVNGVIQIIQAFAAQNYTEGVIDVLKFVKEFIYPICKA